jgi:hypothetical protein
MGMVLAHMNRNKEGSAARGIIRKSRVRPSYSSPHLNFRFYLYVLGPQSNYATLTHNPDNRTPPISFHMFSY